MRKRLIRLAAILLLAVLINAVVFFGEFRFRAPTDPVIMVVLAVGMVRLIEGIQRLHQRKQKHPRSNRR